MSCPCEGLLPTDTIPDPITGEPIPCSEYECPDGETCAEAIDAHCVKVSIDIPSLQLSAGDRMDKALLTLGANASDTNVISSETNSIEISGKGVTTDPLTADIKIDPASSNMISVSANGILVSLTTEQLAAALATVPSLAYLGSNSIEVVDSADNQKTLNIKLASTSATAPLQITEDGLTLNFDTLKSSLNITDTDISKLSQNIVCQDIVIAANYTSDPNKVYVTGGTVTLPSVNGSKSWGLTTKTFSSLISGTTYYLYAQCSKTTQTCLYILVDTVYPSEDATYYYFYLANIYKVVNGRRRMFSYTGSTLAADQLEVGRINSSDGLSFWDLTSGQVQFKTTNASLDIGVTTPGAITLKGAVIQRPSGDTVEFPSFRGAYSSTVVYYSGDMVSYDGQLWSYKYATGTSNHTPAEGDYWTIVVSKGSDGSDGTDGADADVTYYTEFRFQKSASSSVAPQVASTDPIPGGWSTTQPTLSVGEYLWMITARKQSSDNTLVENWSTPSRITGQVGATGSNGADGLKGDTGPAGKAILNSFIFLRSTTQPTTPTEGSFASPVPIGWTDGIPEGTLQLWGSNRLFTSDGTSPQSDVWSTPAAMTDTADIDYEWSAVVNPGNPTDNPSNWTDDASGEDIWMAVRKQTNGVWGTWSINKIKGEDGTDAVGIFKSTVFIRTNTAPSTPTGGTYANPVPSGWSDGIPSGDKQLWGSTRIFTGDGNSPQQAAWSTPVAMSDNAYYDYEWSNIATDPGTPDTVPGNWSDTPVTNTIWMAVRPWKNGEYTSAWVVTKIKGEDAQEHYYWVAYATNASGAGFSTSPTGKTYIGIAYNKTTSVQSTDPTDYTWSLFKGDQGVQGPQGEDGNPTYTWIKYADDVDGTNMSDDPTGKVAIGLAFNKTTQTESTTVTDYTWSLIKGDKGDTGDKGDSGPFLMYRGEYDSAKSYYGGSDRIEAVHFTSTDSSLDGYWVSTIAAGSFSDITPGTASDLHWNKFSGQFESVATSLLLADLAYITNLGVRTLRTSDSGRRLEITSDNNGMDFYSSSGNLVMSISEQAGIGALTFYDTNGNVVVKIDQTGFSGTILNQSTTTGSQQKLTLYAYKANSTNYFNTSLGYLNPSASNDVLPAYSSYTNAVQVNSGSAFKSIVVDSSISSANAMTLYLFLDSGGTNAVTPGLYKDSSGSTPVTTSDIGLYLVSNTTVPFVSGNILDNLPKSLDTSKTYPLSYFIIAKDASNAVVLSSVEGYDNKVFSDNPAATIVEAVYKGQPFDW